jgi:hypothetical protein
VITLSLPFIIPFGNPKEDAENRENDWLFVLVLVLRKGAHCAAILIAASGGTNEICILQ